MSDGKSIQRRGGNPRPASADWFDGHVEAEAILDDKERGVRHGRVHFHDGGRTHWHLHEGHQVLYFVEGLGMVEDRGGELIETEAGDVVQVHPGAVHRHGARDGTSTVHIAITGGDTIWDNDERFPQA